MLLRGRKRFRLYAPDQAPRMHTHGSLRTLHANGRIVYEGQVRCAALNSMPLGRLVSYSYH